jgi:poly-beta-1,6-N-acetyl-D-glucosamine biosynthesis protein PgaD
MKQIIINQPHLQSFQQRCGSIFLSGLSWLLWLYFLLPLFTLGGWLLGLKSLSDEIRWFGGYKTLLQLLQMYGAIIVVIAVGWAIWSLCLSWIHAIKTKKILPQVQDRQLSEVFNVAPEQLNLARSKQKITVHFDNHAVITNLECD